MNLIPKEIKDYLSIFKTYLKKISQSTFKNLDLNYSKIFTGICGNNCEYIPNFDIYLQSSQQQVNISFLLYIKNLDLRFSIETGVFNLVLYVDNQKIIIMKGIITNYRFYIENYAIPVVINIPNKLVFKINLINDKDEEYTSVYDILDKGIINFGISLS